MERETVALLADRESDPSSIEPYAGREWLFQPGILAALSDEIRRAAPGDRRTALERLRAYLWVESLREAAAAEEARLLRCERRPVAIAGAAPIPYRLLAAELAREPNAETRRAWLRAAAPVLAELSALLARGRDRVRRRARALGFASAIELLEAAHARSLTASAAIAERVLAETEAPYRAALREVSATLLGAPAGDVAAADLPRVDGWLAEQTNATLPVRLCAAAQAPTSAPFLPADPTAVDAWAILAARLPGDSPPGAGLAIALGELLALRRAATGVGMLIAWHRGVAQSPLKLYRHHFARGVGLRSDGPGDGPLLRAHDLVPTFRAADRLRAQLLAVQLDAHLRATHGRQWWRSAAAAPRWRQLCARSATLDGEGLAAAIGATGIEVTPAARWLAAMLVRR